MGEGSGADRARQNITDGTLTAGDDPLEGGMGWESFLYLAGALFSLCYLVAGIVCCRCYWLHLRRKMEAHTNAEICYKAPEAGDDAKDVPESVEVVLEEDNEFLDAKCC